MFPHLPKSFVCTLKIKKVATFEPTPHNLHRTFKMASSNPIPLNAVPRSDPNYGPSNDIASFKKVLASSTRVLALCGAGLGASSGLDTFRGPGGMWRNYRAQSLATMDAFTRDPGLVWLFYSYRRHKALAAEPNKGHFALAELAKRMDADEEKGFVCLTQNVDGKFEERINSCFLWLLMPEY